MAEFKPGDTVRLKSGGPAMTVRSVGSGGDDNPLVFCDWFVGDEGKSGHFPPTSLDAVGPAAVGVSSRPKGGGGRGGGSWMR